MWSGVLWVALGTCLTLTPFTLDVRADDATPGETESKPDWDEEVVEAKVKALHKERNREEVRIRIDAMSASADPNVREALIRFSTKNKNLEFVDHTFRALGKIGGERVVEHLTGENGVWHRDFMIQKAAVETLGEMKDTRALDVLVAKNDDRRIKIEVLHSLCLALAKVAPGDERVVAIVFDRAEHKKDTIRAGAVEALGYIAGDKATEVLIDKLENEGNTRVRGAAAKALGMIGGAKVVEPLRTAAEEDRALSVKTLATEALKKMGVALTSD